MILVISVAIGGFLLISLILGFYALRISDKEQTRRDNRLSPAAYVEKKRVLERDRAEWAAVLGTSSIYSTVNKKENATKQMTRIDKQLLELADQMPDERVHNPERNR